MKYQWGFSQLLVLVIVAVLAVGGYATYRFVVPEVDDEVLVDGEMMEKDRVMMEKDEMMSPSPMMEKDDSMMEDEKMMEDDKMMEGDSMMMMKYSGQILAGTSAPLLDFNKADYDLALKTDKLLVLYFYANWCPICRAEFPKMQEAFNELISDKVIGFRVNYNDSETDKDETNLAREHGVAYQHTKVLVKGGQRIGKYPDSWDKNRYLSEINRALGQ